MGERKPVTVDVVIRMDPMTAHTDDLDPPPIRPGQVWHRKKTGEADHRIVIDKLDLEGTWDVAGFVHARNARTGRKTRMRAYNLRLYYQLEEDADGG